MAQIKVRRGVSKAQWLEAALKRLCEQSVADISISALAKDLGIAKSGFYWHFKIRDELLDELLNYWVHEITEVITDNVEINALEPKARLTKCAEMILELDLTRYEVGIRQFAQVDDRARRAVMKANKLRQEFIRKSFSDLGMVFLGESFGPGYR